MDEERYTNKRDHMNSEELETSSILDKLPEDFKPWQRQLAREILEAIERGDEVQFVPVQR